VRTDINIRGVTFIMKMKTMVLAGAIMALAALPANAETKWTGLYVGAFGGLDMTATELSVPAIASIDGLSSKGLGYGVTAGFDYQIPGTKFVVGIGGDYARSDTEFNVTLGPVTALTAGIDDSWSVYGRVGLDAGRVMPYVLAGYSEADVKAAIPIMMWSGSDKMQGWLVGGGLEMALGAGFYVGAEYRYTKFDTLKVDIGAPSDLHIDTDRHEVRAKFSYKLGGLF
jgi:outer membrane immunogenic protein